MESDGSSNNNNVEAISFSVLSIDCISCTPVFKRELQKIPGIKEVKPMVMMKMIKVELDPKATTRVEVKKEILKIATKVGFGGKVVFTHA